MALDGAGAQARQPAPAPAPHGACTAAAALGSAVVGSAKAKGTGLGRSTGGAQRGSSDDGTCADVEGPGHTRVTAAVGVVHHFRHVEFHVHFFVLTTDSAGRVSARDIMRPGGTGGPSPRFCTRLPAPAVEVGESRTRTEETAHPCLGGREDKDAVEQRALGQAPALSYGLWVWPGHVSEERGGGGARGSGTEKIEYQKWPKPIFPFANSFLPTIKYGSGGGGSGGGGGG